VVTIIQSEPKSDATITQQLAAFVVRCNIDNIPAPVFARSKLFALDTLVVALAGARAASSKLVVGLAEKLGGNPQASVIGWPMRTSVTQAALCNGAITHAVELDDDHRTSVLHPGTVVLPAALAMAEYCQADGKTFLAGLIAGYEVMTRIGDAFLGQQYYAGFHSTGTCGVFGAAAAAGRIFGLDEKHLATAFGIAGTQAAGLGEWALDGSWIKRLHPGKSAEAGIIATLLASTGFTGPNTILEGAQGFLKAFSYKGQWDAKIILQDLGVVFRGHATSFKPYACCRFSHQVVDAALAAISKHQIKAEDIESIDVRTHTTAYEKLFVPEARRYEPKSVVDAQFSIPYIIGTAVLHGRPMPQHFTDKAIREPQVLQMARLIKGRPDAEYEKEYPLRYPTLVTFKLKDGRKYSEYADLPSGDPENPVYAANPALFGEEILAKVDALLAPLPEYASRRNEIVNGVSALEQMPDISPIIRLLQPLKS
jgi:2-methylcitrate dehydratase PrpD